MYAYEYLIHYIIMLTQKLVYHQFKSMRSFTVLIFLSIEFFL